MEPEQETYAFWPVFDSFIKKVARYANFRFFQMEQHVRKHVKVTDHVLLCTQLDEQASDDGEALDTLYVYLKGKKYPLTDPELQAALQNLPEESLQILILKFWYEYRENEIAREMKLSIRSCYTKRKRALEQLRRIMEEEHEKKKETE